MEVYSCLCRRDGLWGPVVGLTGARRLLRRGPGACCRHKGPPVCGWGVGAMGTKKGAVQKRSTIQKKVSTHMNSLYTTKIVFKKNRFCKKERLYSVSTHD